MIIKFLGTHNAESSNTRLVSLLIDGVLAIDAGSLTSELSFAEQKKIKAILLSHGHYDHIRDIPTFAFNNPQQTTRVLASQETIGILSSHLVNGIIYPRFTEKTSFSEKPVLKLVPLEPYKREKIAGYQVVAVPVNHSIHALGFEVMSKTGKTMFYTGDTGAGLADVWRHVSPELLITELTLPNSLENTALEARHLCPATLKRELIEFRRIKDYLPRVVLVHLNPWHEREISREMEQVSKELDLPFSIATDGQELTI